MSHDVAQVFETVVPNELTRVRLHIVDGSLSFTPPTLSSRLIVSMARVNVATNIVPDLPRSQMSLRFEDVRALMIDDVAHLSDGILRWDTGIEHWRVSPGCGR